MKLSFLFLFILSISFAIHFGLSRQVVERSWTIINTGPFEFNGSLIVNNSNQKVLSVITDPEMGVNTDDDGTIWLNYSGTGNAKLSAIVIVDVNYEANITGDTTQPKNIIIFTNLTEPNDGISYQAAKVSNSSSLKTIRDVTEWVHSYLTYDLTYWGKSKTAKEVFAEGRGVCVEYSHLFMSMIQTLGFKARYVTGYVFTTAWQPHAWVEVYLPGYGWLPVDPTFNQVGLLDNTHIAIAYGEDQLSIFDSILTMDTKASLTVEDEVSTNFATEDPKGIELDIYLENRTVLFEITNTRPFYTYGTFVSSMLNTQEEKLLLLGPNEKIILTRQLDDSLFDDNYVYNVPVIGVFNDAEASATFQIKKEQEDWQPQTCLSVFVLALLFLFVKH
ncbi:MAG: transglutaminase-like domain-containing protein [Candidatus Micrarchaeota archaeon]